MCIHFGSCSVGLVGAKNRLRIPSGIASENGGIPACLTFLTGTFGSLPSDISSVSFPVSRFGSGTGSSSFPFSLFFFCVNRDQSCTNFLAHIAFRGPLSTISIDSVFARFLSIAYRISSWVSFPSCCSLKRTCLNCWH